MSKLSTLVKNTIIIALGKLSTQFIGFLLLPLYTAYLTKDEFGTVDLITVITWLLAPMVIMSLEMAVFRFLIDSRGDSEQTTSTITNSLQMIIYSILTCTVLYSSVAAFIDIPYKWIIPCFMVSFIASSYCLQITRGMGRNIAYSIGSAVAGVTTIILSIVLTVNFQLGAQGILIATAVGNAACAIFLAYLLKIPSYFNRKLASWQAKKNLLAYSLPLIPNGIFWWLANIADRIIITAILGVATNGIYAVAYKFPQIFTACYNFFSLSWAESASVHINSKDRNQFFSQVIDTALRFLGSFSAILIVGTSIVFGILVNVSYQEARLYIPPLMIGAFFVAIADMYHAIYIARKATKQVLKTSLLAAIASITVSTILIPWIGLFAPAVALVVSYSAVIFIRHRDTKKSVIIHYRPSTIASIILLHTIAIGLYYVQSHLAMIANLLLVSVGAIYINKSMLYAAYKKLITAKDK
ncbi:MAG: oligosaccharide flippase family protein [Candidatus Saccharibacteria bacterium]|nr:oligosaccharide flippase family protein [Candidatus Saccharibacteria bacterium]